jgi:hypothetical protein
MLRLSLTLLKACAALASHLRDGQRRARRNPPIMWVGNNHGASMSGCRRQYRCPYARSDIGQHLMSQ